MSTVIAHEFGGIRGEPIRGGGEHGWDFWYWPEVDTKWHRFGGFDSDMVWSACGEWNYETQVLWACSTPEDSEICPQCLPLPTAQGTAAMRRCRKCGCTDEYGCAEGCYWVAEDLCSACVSDEEGGQA